MLVITIGAVGASRKNGAEELGRNAMTEFRLAMLAGAAALVLLPVAAIAGDPIPGVDVSLEQAPGAIMVSRDECKKARGTVKGDMRRSW